MRTWWKRIRIPILYYHEIGVARGKHVVRPADFEAQLDWLGDAGFAALSMDELVEMYAGRRPVPERSVVLTFDDGRAGVRDHAAPALARRKLPATLYVVTSWLDGEPVPDIERYSDFLRWPDLVPLRQAGISIGSHTVTHGNLKRIAPEAAAREASDSRKRLEDALGAPVLDFSFPYGRRSRAADKAVRDAGYRTAVVTGERWNGRFASLHRLFRLRVDGREPLSAFADRMLAPFGAARR